MNSKADTQNSEPKAPRAFTLIELLVVISVIAILAGLLFAVMPAVTRRSALTAARAELGQIVSAIEAYKAAYNFYPPDNPANVQTSQRVNPLYLELVGTIIKTNGATQVYTTLDGSFTAPVSTVTSFLQIGGLVNSSANPTATDERPAPVTFLKDLRPGQIGTNNLNLIRVLVPSADETKIWRYNSSNPTNNPGSYDLSFELVLQGKTNLISNWRN
jgi:prepilin-type N-terminal cleavage/methylation domain-containing protein